SIDAGVPADLAARAARWPWMHPGFDIVEIAREQACSIEKAMTAYWSMFDGFDLFWLWDGIGALPRSDRWQTQARSALRADMMTPLAGLTAPGVGGAGGAGGGAVVWGEGRQVAAGVGADDRSVARAQAMFTEIRRAETFDMTNLSVALRQ